MSKEVSIDLSSQEMGLRSLSDGVVEFSNRSPVINAPEPAPHIVLRCTIHREDVALLAQWFGYRLAEREERT